MFLGSLNLVPQSLLGQQAVARRVSVAVVKRNVFFLILLAVHYEKTKNR